MKGKKKLPGETPQFPISTAPFLFLFAAEIFRRAVHSSFPSTLSWNLSMKAFYSATLSKRRRPRSLVIFPKSNPWIRSQWIRSPCQRYLTWSLFLTLFPWLPRPHSSYFSYFSGRLPLISRILNTGEPQGWPLDIFSFYAHLLGESSRFHPVS